MIARALITGFAVVLAACMPPPSRLVPQAPAPSALLPQAILPADLDAVIWFDLTRLRDLWTTQPDLQITRVLTAYGVFDANPTEPDDEYWRSVVSHSERLWVACRPSSEGCRDSVVLARGRFAQFEPRKLLDRLQPAVDLGAGWFRYDRGGVLRRAQPARIYLAAPDQCVTAPVAELDAVERNLELGRGEPALSVEERGLLSMTLRGPAIAALVASRSPSAARLLSDVDIIRAWLALNTQELELTVVAAFGEPERAARSGRVLSMLLQSEELWKGLGVSFAPAVEVVDRDVTIRLRFRAQAQPAHSSVLGH